MAVAARGRPFDACDEADGGRCGNAFKTLDGKPTLIVGHRGSPGSLPEHTLEGYKLAIEQGADFVEPHLVLTKDGVLVARHEPVLGASTDVADKFPASRKTTRNLDGVSTTAYFSGDFTLAEIKTLRAKQPTATRPQQFNGQYSIPTLDEIISTVKSESARVGRTVGIYPEIKHSTFHAAAFGANVFEDKLVAALHAAYGNADTAPVFIQSFEVSNLQYLNTRTNIRLVKHAFAGHLVSAPDLCFDKPLLAEDLLLRIEVSGSV